MRFITAYSFTCFILFLYVLSLRFKNNIKFEFYHSQGYDRKKFEKKASQWVSKPGTSEHQLGLSMDLVSYEYQLLDKKQEETKEQMWLMNHCAEYGFILRYPVSKSSQTRTMALCR